jgi:UPF0716 protein FxsA
MGAVIGVFPTVLIVVLTAIIGVWLLRVQSFLTFRRLQEHLQQGQAPAMEMIEGPILLVGGALLLTPGFFTDAIGFLCLLPNTRRWIAHYCMTHVFSEGFSSAMGGQGQRRNAEVIEGEFKKEED